jgi:hypothetical protein
MKGCRSWSCWARPGLALVIAWAGCAAAAAAADRAWYTSDFGWYRLAFESDLDPIEINRMHGWVLTLRGRNGEPVDDAFIEVAGGMPAHDHGLPTRPRITHARGGGVYRLDGLRFHMPGAWEVVVQVRVDGRVDRVVIPLTL